MTMRFRTFLLIAALTLGVYLAASPRAEEPRPVAAGGASFADSIMAALGSKTAAIFAEDCARCHGGARPAAQLSLEKGRFAAALVDKPSRQVSAQKLVDSRRPETSYFLMKVRGAKGIERERMPLGGPPLDREEIRALELWAFATAALAGPANPAAPR